jgi:hypothetical protein
LPKVWQNLIRLPAQVQQKTDNQIPRIQATSLLDPQAIVLAGFSHQNLFENLFVSAFDNGYFSGKLVKLLCAFFSENLQQHPIFENSTVCTKTMSMPRTSWLAACS